jgi:hypothetical protein
MLEVFSTNYETARQRFRQVAGRIGWQLEAHPIDAAEPDGRQLTIDVAWSPKNNSENALVLSSGLHGVEGFFGSAVQIGLLEKWSSGSSLDLPFRCVFLHGLNPFGFYWVRRFDENNVDPNRNFLLTGERYEGFPAGYDRLDGLLNPRRPPSRREPFTLKALWAILRFGMPRLRQVVASGQYKFPQGLFFGGAGPSRTHQILAENFKRWLGGSSNVVHLDFHTGLGPSGACKLLIDYPLREGQKVRPTEWFGADSFETCDSSSIAYDARGGFGQWCVASNLAAEYLFACAEYGTYGPIQVLAGLRAENQAYHWSEPSAASTIRAKQELKELFCPSATAWRTQVLGHSFQMVERVVLGLSSAR